jgi:alkylated DNA repair dioxygenase AlkB
MGQQDLFQEPVDANLPGLRYQPEFIDVAAERELVATIRTLPIQEAQYKEYRAKRRVMHFGGRYDFDRNELLPAAPIPQFLRVLRTRVIAWAGLDAEQLTQAVIAEYRAGTQLGWHRDVPLYETIVGVSLVGACRMRFRPYPADRTARCLDLRVAARSAYMMQGAARWDWQHCVAPTPALRYSITFRTRR